MGTNYVDTTWMDAIAAIEPTMELLIDHLSRAYGIGFDDAQQIIRYASADAADAVEARWPDARQFGIDNRREGA